MKNVFLTFKSSLTTIAIGLSLLLSPFMANAQTVNIETRASEGKVLQVEVPLNPQRVVALNYETIDILDSLGLGDRIVGMIKKGGVPKHLQKYADNPEILDMGGMKEINMEALVAVKPDIIFPSGRTAKQYSDFIKIAPTVVASVAMDDGFFSGFKANAMNHAKIFDKEKEVSAILKNYESRLQQIAKKTSGQSVICITSSNGKLNVAPGNAKSIATTDLGLKNLAPNLTREEFAKLDIYELISKANPDFIFVLDRGKAIGQEAPYADTLMKHEQIESTSAAKNNKIVYYEPVQLWYVNTGGLTALDLMLTELEKLPL